tara:strand:+ start:1791 stop:2501 length:711 start_codon:yes stop_codon:yes gene_type:complete
MTEFIAGCFSGLAQNIIGHPFDTVKVLIQNNKLDFMNSKLNSTNSTLNNMKLLKSIHYYKGFAYPTLLSIILNGITFETFNGLKTIKSHYLNGFFTGLVTSPIVYVFDVGKVKKQVGKTLKFKSFYNTPGFTMTVFRESIALSIYLGSYFSLRDNNYSALFSGGLSGFINWTVTYPIDVIKNRQMSDNLTITNAYKRGNLWKGYNICAFRGIIVNAAGFYVYEMSRNISFEYNLKN